AAGQVVDKVRDVVAPGIAHTVGKTGVIAALEGNFQAVVVGAAIVGGQLEERVVATGIQVGEREDHTTAGDFALIGIAQAIHLAGEVAYVADVQSGVGVELNFRPEAELIDVSGSLIGILRADLQRRKRGSRGSNGCQRESVFQLELG